MILRSVTKHVKDQNWFAVFLDLLIVVIGVFIGIQVSGWNEERVGKKQADNLIKRLQVDIKNDQEVMASTIAYQEVVRNYSIQAINALNGDESVSDEQFVIAAYQASQINPPWSNRSTFSEILSTGQLNLLKSDDLKISLLGYYSDDWAKQAITTEVAPYRKFIRSLMPFKVQDAIRRECSDIAIPLAQSFGAALPASCDLDLADELFTQTADFLRQQSDLLFELQYQVSVNDVQVYNLENFDLEAQKVLLAIQAYKP